jgi:hypothetical protein
MKKHREPEALRELHKIREQIHKEALAVGIERYYEELNQKSGWLLGKGKKRPHAAVREHLAKYKVR